MFKKLTVINFQRFKKYSINLNRPVTVLVGPTDVGKSTIARALHVLCFNKPIGPLTTRLGSSFFKLELEVDDHVIVRKKGKKGNYYAVDGERFGFDITGRSVPAEVAKVLQVTPTNFAMQIEPAFWFSIPAGQVSKALNSIINLSSIDDSLSYIANELRQAKASSAVIEERCEQAKAKRETLSWVESFDERLQTVERLFEQFEAKRNRLRGIDGTLADVQNCEESIDRASNAKLALGKVVETGDLLLQKQKQLNAIQKSLKAIEELDQVLDQPAPDIAKLDPIWQSWNTKKKQMLSVSRILDEIETLDKTICTNQNLADDGLTRLHREMKGRCPLCEQPIPKTKATQSV